MDEARGKLGVCCLKSLTGGAWMEKSAVAAPQGKEARRRRGSRWRAVQKATIKNRSEDCVRKHARFHAFPIFGAPTRAAVFPDQFHPGRRHSTPDLDVRLSTRPWWAVAEAVPNENTSSMHRTIPEQEHASTSAPRRSTAHPNAKFELYWYLSVVTVHVR
jgi:hypothetical protein